jgi:hypothetical protein
MLSSSQVRSRLELMLSPNKNTASLNIMTRRTSRSLRNHLISSAHCRRISPKRKEGKEGRQ